MMTYLTFAVFVALFVNGLNATTWQGMLFAKFGDWMTPRLNRPIGYLLKPLIGCVWCMPVWYALLINHLTGYLYPLEAFLCGVAAMPIAGWINAKFESQ